MNARVIVTSITTYVGTGITVRCRKLHLYFKACQINPLAFLGYMLTSLIGQSWNARSAHPVFRAVFTGIQPLDDFITPSWLTILLKLVDGDYLTFFSLSTKIVPFLWEFSVFMACTIHTHTYLHTCT